MKTSRYQIIVQFFRPTNSSICLLRVGISHKCFLKLFYKQKSEKEFIAFVSRFPKWNLMQSVFCKQSQPLCSSYSIEMQLFCLGLMGFPEIFVNEHHHEYQDKKQTQQMLKKSGWINWYLSFFNLHTNYFMLMKRNLKDHLKYTISMKKKGGVRTMLWGFFCSKWTGKLPTRWSWTLGMLKKKVLVCNRLKSKVRPKMWP